MFIHFFYLDKVVVGGRAAEVGVQVPAHHRDEPYLAVNQELLPGDRVKPDQQEFKGAY